MRKCLVAGCDSKHRARGLCQSNYGKALNAGGFATRKIAPKNSTPQQQLDATGWDVLDNECWAWRGAQLSGYGRIGKAGHGESLAHRVAYLAHYGPIPSGMAIHHTCANRLCVNPAHLQPISERENMAEMMQRTYYLMRIQELELEVSSLKAMLAKA